MKKQKFLAWLLTGALAVTMLPATAFAGEIEADVPEEYSIVEEAV